MQIDFRPIDQLIPYARNARTHSAAQISMIAASIVEFGFTNSVLADEKGIVAGHGRCLGAQKVYDAGQLIKLPNGTDIPQGTVPVIDCTGWSETKRRAYILADNQLALASGWDSELLKLELADIKAEGFDLDLLGFGDELLDIMGIMEGDDDKDPDELPNVPEVAFSQLGDMYTMGAHRVRCGSSTDQSDWDALMQGELADIQACDPPYNVNFHSDLAGSIKNDNMKDAEFRQFLLDFYTCSFAVMKPGAPMYVAHSDSEGINFRQGLIDAGFKLQGCLQWKKNQFVLGRMDYQSIHEPILYAWKSGSKHRWYGGRKNISVQDVGEYPPFEKLDDGRFAIRYNDQVLYVDAGAKLEEQPTSIIYHDKPKKSPLHPTQKPSLLWERLIRNSARPNDIVIDGFGGSGTTMVAAERLGMCSRLMELDCKFVDVICARYFMLTGRVPVHFTTGEPFPMAVIQKLIEKNGGSEN